MNRVRESISDDAHAVIFFQKAADQNHSGALLELGQRYHYGRGVEEDEKKGLDLIKQAADLQHPKAQFIYGARWGDQKSKVKYWKLSAEQGFAPAEFSLYFIYCSGTGLEKIKKRLSVY